MTPIIDPNKKYRMIEIYENEFIPGINTYAKLYKLAVDSVIVIKDGKKLRKAVVRTDPDRLPIVDDKNPWNANSLFFVLGSDLIDYIKRFPDINWAKHKEERKIQRIKNIKNYWKNVDPKVEADRRKRISESKQRNKLKREEERMERERQERLQKAARPDVKITL